MPAPTFSQMSSCSAVAYAMTHITEKTGHNASNGGIGDMVWISTNVLVERTKNRCLVVVTSRDKLASSPILPVPIHPMIEGRADQTQRHMLRIQLAQLDVMQRDLIYARYSAELG